MNSAVAKVAYKQDSAEISEVVRADAQNGGEYKLLLRHGPLQKEL